VRRVVWESRRGIAIGEIARKEVGRNEGERHIERASERERKSDKQTGTQTLYSDDTK
jgi:hypothetical protein